MLVVCLASLHKVHIMSKPSRVYGMSMIYRTYRVS